MAQLAAALERTARDPGRLWPALELNDEQLIAALGGELRESLTAAWHSWDLGTTRHVGCSSALSGHAVCRHHCTYPPRLATDPLAPHALVLRGDIESLGRLDSRAVVAIAGPRTPSDYGRRCAHSLARELAASDVTVVCTNDDFGACARAGALDANGQTIVVTSGDGVDDRALGEGQPPSWTAGKHVCHVAEPALAETRSSLSQLSAQRTLTLLADLVLVVEASAHGVELACAGLARSRRVRLGTVPGPIDSPLSDGTNAMLDDSQTLVVRGVCDALDALTNIRKRRPARPKSKTRHVRRGEPTAGKNDVRAPGASTCPPPALEQRLAHALGRVRRGEDTLARLCIGERDCKELALALTELELLGLLRRSEGGRYVASAEHLS